MSARQDMYSVSVTVDGRDCGIWDKFSGGAGDSEERKYPPGGMRPERSLGGRATTENITIQRLLDSETWELQRWLFARRGRARVTAAKQPLDENGVPFGAPLTYNGTLKAVTPPDVDSESSEASLLEIEVTVDGEPT